MNDTDHLAGPHGHFLLKVFRAGLLVPELCVDEPNLIVDLSKTAHARLLGTVGASGYNITQIAFGTSGTAPAAGNTAITGQFPKVLDGITYPTANTVQFAFSLATTENNGMAILEFGLLDSAGRLYARKVRSVALNKASDISFAGTWTITF